MSAEIPRDSMQRQRLGELLAAMDAESGPVPEHLMEEARHLWKPGAGDEPGEGLKVPCEAELATDDILGMTRGDERDGSGWT
jgi:hypothetical protein